MENRIKRYKEFTENKFLESVTHNTEYSLDLLLPNLVKKIKKGQFNKLLFTGMGCSAIVADVIKGFFVYAKIPIFVEVLNDYEWGYFVDKSVFDDKTLVIISSYSGFSKEPIEAYKKIKTLTTNILFLTTGGNLEKIAKKDKLSVIKWELKNPDREYPLFHAPQYFSILLDIFYTLGVIDSNFASELVGAKNNLLKSQKRIKNKARKISKEIIGKDIVLLATPRWYVSLLKLTKMHLNEIAMVPAHRNHLHEFAHSEVAICSDSKNKQAIVLFTDKNEDNYSSQKINSLKSILETSTRSKVVKIVLDQKDFFQKFLSALLLMQYVTLFIGEKYNIESKELISRAAGNDWYSINTIRNEKK